MLMKTYHWMTQEVVEYDLTGSQCWAFHAAAVEMEARVWGGNLRRVNGGYVKREVNRLLKERGLA